MHRRWGSPVVLGLVALVVGGGCGREPPRRSSPALPEVEEALAPFAVDVHADETFVMDQHGALSRIRGPVRETIDMVDLSPAGLETIWWADVVQQVHLSVGADESIWLACRALSGRWEDGEWTAGLTVAPGSVRAIAARMRDDAWLVWQEWTAASGGTESLFHACHWDGSAWACELVDGARDGAAHMRVSLSSSFVWLLTPDGVVRRRDERGAWSPAEAAGSVQALFVFSDDEALAAGDTIGLARWDGAAFVAVSPGGRYVGARAVDDAWVVTAAEETYDTTSCSGGGLLTPSTCSTTRYSAWRQLVVHHFDGASTTEIGHVDRTSDFPVASYAALVLPVAEDEAQILVMDGERDAAWHTTTPAPGCSATMGSRGRHGAWLALLAVLASACPRRRSAALLASLLVSACTPAPRAHCLYDRMCGLGLACEAGRCVPRACDGDESLCGSDCLDLTSDTRNCGSCGNHCYTSDWGARSTCGDSVCSAQCLVGFHACGGACKSDHDADACGDGCTACSGAPDGTATCELGACAIACAPGTELAAAGCVPSSAPPPRPIAPLSLAVVGTARPTLRWELMGATDGARVELCADRACTEVIETIDAVGSETSPRVDLPIGATFWRLAPMIAGAVMPGRGATWELVVSARRVSSDVSCRSVLDVDGDGLADLAVATGYAERTLVAPSTAEGATLYCPDGYVGGSSGAASIAVGDIDGDGFGDLLVSVSGILQGDERTRVYVYRGGAPGIDPAPSVVIEEPGASTIGSRASLIGDVDGDGYGDLAVDAGYDPVSGATVSVYLGGPRGPAGRPAFAVPGMSPTPAGDVNADGYADFLLRTAPGVSVALGGPDGPLAPVPLSATALDGAGAGDVDGDGFCDVLLVDAVTTSVRLHRGGASGVDTAALALETPPPLAPPTFGPVAASAGDVDLDGDDDVVVGIPESNLALVFLGEPGGIERAPHATLTPATDPLASTGLRVGSPGDVDGDGRSDIVVAAPGQDPTGMAFVYLARADGTWPAPDRALESVDTAVSTPFASLLATR